MAKRVYLLEDDEGIRDVVSMLLKEENYEVESFQNVNEFMSRDHHQKADLFILDVMLPDGNGIDVCTLLKNSDSTRKIPVLMMSANANKNQVELSCSAEGFVAKPFDIHSLLNKVAMTLKD
ncbi:PleD family two-component system response regulator [Pedobacter aquatilis]|uniref:response regulator n=1 Tax=Pedobacter aquatilis TaxID=351343 RepID=UPI002930021C|nr:response regulator [Pedobacter aquatilis]